MKLVDKDTLVTEIKKRQKEEVFYDEDGSFASWADQNHYSTLESIKNFLDILEVKEVDLEKEIIDWWNTHYSEKDYTFEGHAGHYLENSTVIDIAKYFFELGLKAQKGE